MDLVNSQTFSTAEETAFQAVGERPFRKVPWGELEKLNLKVR